MMHYQLSKQISVRAHERVLCSHMKALILQVFRNDSHPLLFQSKWKKMSSGL